MKRLACGVLSLIFLVCPVSAQVSGDPLGQAMDSLMRESARHRNPGPALTRTMALVVVSARRLEELKADANAAGAFRARLLRQVRRAEAVLGLVGSGALGEVREELAGNVLDSLGSGGIEPAVTRLMGAVADREYRSGSNQEITETVQAMIAAVRAGPGSQEGLARLLIEAAAVIQVFGAHAGALSEIRQELSAGQK